MSYVYIHERDAGTYTVGFFNPQGEFIPESDHPSPGYAAARVNYLNGGKGLQTYEEESLYRAQTYDR